MTLKRDVKVKQKFPKELLAKKKKLKFTQPSVLSTPEFYLKELLPVLKRKGVLGLSVSGGGCLKVLAFLLYRSFFLVRYRLDNNVQFVRHHMFSQSSTLPF
jgi:hypothetical protein